MMRIFLTAALVAALMTGCKSRKMQTAGEIQSTPVTTAESSPPERSAAPLPTGPSPVAYTPFMTGLPDAGMWKCDPVLVDLNGDDVRDLAAIPRLRVNNLGDGPRFWFGSKDGAWRLASEGLDPGERSCGGGVDLADLNGDGFLDLAAADHCNGIFVYFGDSQGNWRMVTRQMYPDDLTTDPDRKTMYMGAEDLVLGDVNKDGHWDIVAGASDRGGIHVYLGDGTGENWRRLTGTGLPQDEWATRVELADFNGDGTLDLVASFADGPRVWHGQGDGTFTEASQGLPSPIMRGIYTGLAVGDINQDGLLDFAIANWVDGPEVYLQQADRSWAKAPDVFPDMLGGAIGLDLGDLDGDGKLDIVCSGRLSKDGGFVRGVFPLFGDGTGRFRHLTGSGLPDTGLAATTGVVIADIDGDGVPDIATGSGLAVETAPGPTEPSIPQRLLVWRGQKKP